MPYMLRQAQILELQLSPIRLDRSELNARSPHDDFDVRKPFDDSPVIFHWELDIGFSILCSN
jgi:hypothetical protein